MLSSLALSRARTGLLVVFATGTASCAVIAGLGTYTSSDTTAPSEASAPLDSSLGEGEVGPVESGAADDAIDEGDAMAPADAIVDAGTLYEAGPNGTPCGVTAQCTSGFCVDGVCCDSSCGGGAADCQACSKATGAAMDGTCTVAASGTVCRPSAGICDVAESCNGSSGVCPPDAFLPSSTVCHSQVNSCAPVAASCTGSAAACPFAAAPIDTDCAYSPVFTVYAGGAPNANTADNSSGYASQSLTGGVTGIGWPNVLRFTATASGMSGNLYDYWKFSGATYLVHAGDYVEYDVSLASSAGGLGGIDVMDNSSATYWRDVGWSDQNAISGHPASDISAKAFGGWYHRRLAVPASRVGATIVRWDVVDESDTTGATQTAYYDNVVVTRVLGGCDGAGSCKVKTGGACSQTSDCATNVCTGSVCAP
jgi:hypothetical protein